LSTFDSDSIGDLDLMPVAFSRRSNNISEEKVAPKPPETNTSADDASKRTDGSSSSSISDAPDLLPKVTQATQEPSSSLDIQDYVPDSHNDVHTEIDCSLIAHPPYQQRPPPRLRDFNAQTSPRQHRQKVGVSQWFNPPISRLWSNKFEEFNHFQSEMSHVMCGSDDNVVVSAPTGAGKSTIFEMAMARFFAMNLQAEMQHPGQFNTMSKARKILYIAPSKALCEERYDDWSRRLRAMGLGIEVALVTGDAIDPGTSFSELISAHFVITTPEKWDAMTRRWTENFYLMASIKLLLVDEVHFLCDENRGWCLETVVTRMKTVHRIARSLNVTREELKSSSYPATNPEAIRSNFRMIAVSATLPNMEEFADFFMANEAYAFDESYRPVPLEKHVLAMGTVGKNDYTFWSNLVRNLVFSIVAIEKILADIFLLLSTGFAETASTSGPSTIPTEQTVPHLLSQQKRCRVHCQ
jgi:superfamily II RNA helicase